MPTGRIRITSMATANWDLMSTTYVILCVCMCACVFMFLCMRAHSRISTSEIVYNNKGKSCFFFFQSFPLFTDRFLLFDNDDACSDQFGLPTKSGQLKRKLEISPCVFWYIVEYRVSRHIADYIVFWSNIVKLSPTGQIYLFFSSR